MRWAIAIAGVLACVASVAGTIRIFVTTSSDLYGLEDSANAFIPTVSTVFANGVTVNGYDYWADYDGTLPGPLRPGGFPPVDAPAGTADNPVQVQPGDFAYVWLQFQNEPKGAKINGLQINVRELGTQGPAPVTVSWYLCNNVSNVINNKRWDGTATPPDYPEWRGNPLTCVAITAAGLVNTTTNLPWNLYNGVTRTALLGAIQAPADGTIYELQSPTIWYFAPPAPQVVDGIFQFAELPVCAGDLNCDGNLDFADINPFVMYLSNYAAWEQTFPGCNPLNGDINGDGTYPSLDDIDPFVSVMLEPGGCP
jgi:hypothetical protein